MITVVPEDNRYTGYQKNGNIACFNIATDTCNTASPDYTYDGSKFHAVASKAGTGSSAGAYTYNANGSMLTGPNRSITWTSFNKVARIDNTASGAYAAFAYDPNRARYKQVTATATTIYAGALYERVEEGATTTHKFHIFAGGSAVAIYSCTTHCGEDPDTQAAGDTRDETFYFHKDHLGSISVITDGHGVEKERFVYTAWGEQQAWDPAANGGIGDYVPATSQKQTRGYTGHEMLNDLGLIHMNGRVFDPALGRFISADPFVQFPNSTQSYNRYSYLGNNPLNATDPSGYFSWRKTLSATLGLGVAGVAGAAWAYDHASQVGEVASAVAPFLNYVPYCQIWCAAAASAVGGYLQTGDWRQGMRAGILTAIGSAIAHTASGGSLHIRAFSGAISGGAMSAAGGGRFGDGFLGGLVGGYAGGISTGGMAGDMIIGAIVGGTVSDIGGGKFANGAISGAFAAAMSNMADGLARGDAEAFPAREGDTATGKYGLFEEYADDPVYQKVYELGAQSNRLSSRSNAEYHSFGGEGADGVLTFQDLRRGQSGRVDKALLTEMAKDFDGTVEYSFHNHGSDFNSPGAFENFSPSDLSFYGGNPIVGPVIGFGATPRGLLLMHDFNTGVTTQIGRVPPVRRPLGR
ncbi:MAG TPA: RHS repeat-associated core domain-containing protein [Gammaproteobacteria bacterium]